MTDFKHKITVRAAKESDIPTILTLVLTSFSNFPFFTYIYSPLATNPDFAHDTVYYWRKRLLLGLLDPQTSIVVAEAPIEVLGDVDEEGESFKKGKVAQDWSERNIPGVRGKGDASVVVGFAIWQFNQGSASSQTFKIREKTLYEKIRTYLIVLEVSAWNKVYQRKDQDPHRMGLFLDAMGNLCQTELYTAPHVYLDNLTVDFRCQRKGIGRLLMDAGVSRARETGGEGVSLVTEASLMGLGLYLKVGFKEVGKFVIGNESEDGNRDRENEVIILPVLQMIMGAENSA
ncbi:acyl-CoA N-acyltransferase [Tricladium varicosporioides]|nr:acyl-CoA N-acyltransferase [Hymenoscyphus varicosporioides]